MDYVPGYTTDELRNFASTYKSEYFKESVSSIVNRVHGDVLRNAKSGKDSSTTDITSRYTIDEINASIVELQRIFPRPTTVTLISLEYSKSIVVSWA